ICSSNSVAPAGVGGMGRPQFGFPRVRRIAGSTIVFAMAQIILRSPRFGGVSGISRNFSPPSTTREIEDYAVELNEVTTLELSIVADKSGGEARASLFGLRLSTRKLAEHVRGAPVNKLWALSRNL